MKQITLHDKAHEAPFILPDVHGTIEHIGDTFRLMLPKFWNEVPPIYQERSEPDAMARVNAWIEWMNAELGYTIKGIKEISDAQYLTHSSKAEGKEVAS